MAGHRSVLLSRSRRGIRELLRPELAVLVVSLRRADPSVLHQEWRYDLSSRNWSTGLVSPQALHRLVSVMALFLPVPFAFGRSIRMGRTELIRAEEPLWTIRSFVRCVLNTANTERSNRPDCGVGMTTIW
jgi:hypothetical protein